MNSQQLSDRLVYIDDEMNTQIIKDIPIAVIDASERIAEHYARAVIDASERIAEHYARNATGDFKTDLIEVLANMYVIGYIGAKAEQRIILEDSFIN
jgi:hypothetical protein